MRDLDLFEAIARRRRAVRAFLPQCVDRALIERLVAAATTTPSSCNTQPWTLHITSGMALDRLRVALIDAVSSGVPPEYEVEAAGRYEGQFRERQIDAAVRLFETQGVDRNDKAARAASMLHNFAFFGAPHAAFLFMPPDGGLREAADCSKFAQTFMLALAAAGLGSCPQASLSGYPSIIRAALRLDNEPGKLLLGMSFGYPDDEDPTALARPPRATTQDVVCFHSD
ncbi:nitroreductase [Hephaestia caeni]|uniref:Nitroreductase n=2 Tax=Hephaestia caeni TaxID=645617 RepID=A0A397PC87_9SPHN|nr:nitroreductase [Hephaestia caeni]